MQAIDWNELISVTKSYMHTRDELDRLTKQENQLSSTLPYMENIFSLCSVEAFQRIFNLYMPSPIQVNEESYMRLSRDIASSKSELTTCKKELKKMHEHEDRRRRYIQLILSDIMDDAHKEQCCHLYCPEKFITSENLPVLKFIVSFARSIVHAMYNGEGGFAYGDSVIGNLSQRVDELEKKLKA